MKKTFLILSSLLLSFCLYAETVNTKVLYVYDETNDSTALYVPLFRSAFASEGIAYDEIRAAELKGKDLSPYNTIVIHGIVMGFNSKSPIRDWLKTSPNIAGKKVSLLVTANRWYLKELFADLTGLLSKNNADVIDAVSMATKDMDVPSKTVAVKKQISRSTEAF